jgi:DNA primase
MDNNKKEKLLSLLGKHVGTYSTHGNDECAFHCPFCHHHKRKLFVNLESQKWHCWVCNSKGKRLYNLLKPLNVSSAVLSTLKSILGEDKYKASSEDETHVNFSLPNEFISMIDAPMTFETKNAAKYIKSRGLSRADVMKYNIGYCATGMYKNHIIVPSYDQNNNLNYFIARSYYDAEYKYKNPPITKDQIVFESHISYDLPIVLVEGIFDAMAVKRNAIPLLGKTIMPKLFNKLLEKNVKEIYIMLDPDARDEAIKIAESLQKQHITTYVITELNEDPADNGFVDNINLIREAKEIDFSDLIKLQFK